MREVIIHQAKMGNLPPGYASRYPPEGSSLDLFLEHGNFEEPTYLVKAFQSIDPSEFRSYRYEALESVLRDQIRRHFQSEIPNARNTYFGHGANHLLERVFTYLFRGAHVLGLGPQFPYMVRHSLANDGKYSAVCEKLMQRQYGVRRLQNEIANSRADYSVLYLDNPNNPTGSVIDPGEIEDLIRSCHRVGMTVVLDEAYGDYVEEGHSAIHLVSKYPNVCVIRSFSKFFAMAGMRVGYMVLSDELATKMENYRQPFEPGAIGYRCAIAALSDLSYISRVRTRVQGLKKYLVERLANTNVSVLPTDSRTSICLLSSKHREFHRGLQQVGIVTCDGASFKATHPAMDSSFVRVRVPDAVESVNRLVGAILRFDNCEYLFPNVGQE